MSTQEYPYACLTVAALLAMGLFTPASVRADIYQQIDDQGVICFTDTPTGNGYALIMRERHQAGQPASSRHKLPRHLAAIEAARPADFAPKPTSDSGTRGVLPVHGRITSLAGLRNDPFDGRLRHHNGMDIACPSGTPVKPVAAGAVLFSGTRPGYGNIVVIEHNNSTVTLYAHNSANLVSVGDPVDQATVIALSGSTGRSTGPHLHFEAWQNGENITHSYLPGASPAPASGRVVAEAPIRRSLQPDGTLLFTNLHW